MTYNWFGGDGYAASGVEAAAGIGLLIGSLFMLVWGGGKRLVPVLVVAGMAIGAAALRQVFCHNRVSSPSWASSRSSSRPRRSSMRPFAAHAKAHSAGIVRRAMGIFGSLTALASPVGLFVAGPAADMLGVNYWFVVCGALLCIAMGLSLLSRSLRALDDQDVNDPTNLQT